MKKSRSWLSWASRTPPPYIHNNECRGFPFLGKAFLAVCVHPGWPIHPQQNKVQVRALHYISRLGTDPYRAGGVSSRACLSWEHCILWGLWINRPLPLQVNLHLKIQANPNAQGTITGIGSGRCLDSQSSSRGTCEQPRQGVDRVSARNEDSPWHTFI